MKLKLVNLFPPKGVVLAENRQKYNWRLIVTYTGKLVVAADSPLYKYRFPLGITLGEVLAYKVDGDGLPVKGGIVTRYSEEPDILRIIVNYNTVLINRKNLEEISSR